MLSEHHRRLPLMAFAGLSLLAALWGGVVRLGWTLPPLAPSLPGSHGPLMVVGFLGTLIGLERAVALQRGWAYGVPLFSGLSALTLLSGLSLEAAQILAVASSLLLISIFIVLYRQQPSGFFATMGLGAVLWLVGNSLWSFGYLLSQVVPWWIGFLVLTIAGERLELSRLTPLSHWDRLKFPLTVAIFLSGLVASLLAFSSGVWFGGLGLLALAFWLVRYDVAWLTVRQKGLPRFMAISLLTGYVWLGVGGLLWMGFSDFFDAGPRYDIMLHSIFLGFVFSMIFGHAPIIFPSVTGLRVPFREVFYSHLVLLHLSLLLRIGSDLVMWMPGHRWGGLLNVLTILLFLANNAFSVMQGRFEAEKST